VADTTLSLIPHAWPHDSLSELSVSRQEFAEALRHRGWEYDTAKHLWRKGPEKKERLLWDEAAPA
jgi:hypothetical protein